MDIFRRGNKQIEVAKKGNNYYATVKVDNEPIMTIVQPPSSVDNQTELQAGVQLSVYDPNGKLRVKKIAP